MKPPHSPSHPINSPTSRLVTKREFLGQLGQGMLGTWLAASAVMTAGCRPGGEVLEGAEDHHSLLEKELGHEFYQDPQQWLRENHQRLRDAYDVSGAPVERIDEYCIDEGIVISSEPGIRIRRTPGSNILTNEEMHLQGIADHIRMKSEHAHHKIAYTAYSHESCGACKLYIQQQEDMNGHPDDHGKDEILDRVQKLQILGIDARYGGHVSLESMQRPIDRHPAAGIIVDATGGRLQNHRNAGMPDSYIVSSHDADEILEGVQIARMIAASSQGYGMAMKELTVTLFADQKRAHLAAAAEERIRGMNNEADVPAIRLIRAEAPV